MKRVGDNVVMKCETIGRILPGTVVYVHPKRYFYTVKFFTNGGSFCEAFLMDRKSRIPSAVDFRSAYISQM